jgi:hypothetical protein
MANAYLDWLGSQADRDLARQRAQVDTAKLLATFSAAVAVTLVATALQVGQSVSSWDKLAVLGDGALTTHCAGWVTDGDGDHGGGTGPLGASGTFLVIGDTHTSGPGRACTLW